MERYKGSFSMQGCPTAASNQVKFLLPIEKKIYNPSGYKLGTPRGADSLEILG
jgi:hypothetical protein